MQEAALPLAGVHQVGRALGRTASAAPSVFLSTSADVVPAALLHNLKHNQVLHERVLILNVKVEEVPHVSEEKRIEVHDAGDGFYRVILHYGFMEEVDIPRDLAGNPDLRRAVQHDENELLPRPAEADRVEEDAGNGACGASGCSPGCCKSSESAMEFFKLPTNRVVELGSQLQI